MLLSIIFSRVKRVILQSCEFGHNRKYTDLGREGYRSNHLIAMSSIYVFLESRYDELMLRFQALLKIYSA